MLPDPTYGGAFLAGLLSFLTPCILPMVPFYLSYMAGMSIADLRGSGQIAPGARRRLVALAVAFAMGVTTIFMLMGMGATALGQAFRAWMEPLSYLAATILMLFGLQFLGLLRLPILYRQARLGTSPDPSTLVGAYGMGLAFGFGWTPCVGPALAAILMIASGMADVSRGGGLLFAYGIGMTAPFVVTALFAPLVLALLQRRGARLALVEKFIGAMLIAFAALIVTGSMNRIAALLTLWIPGFAGLG